MVIAGEGNFRDNERWLSRARAFPSRFSGWNHSASATPSITIRLNMLATLLFKHPIHLDLLTSATPDHSIRLETLATPIFKYSIRLDISANAAPDYPILLNMPITHPPDHPIRFGVPAMGEKLPQRGYTFDSPGLPTIGGYPG